MICFYRRINEKELVVYIENFLYKKHSYIFDEIFITFEKKNDAKFRSDSLYLYSKSRYVLRNKIANDSLRCDLTKNNWVFMMINTFEYWCAKILNCTILHGCLLRFNSLNIALIGKRKSGKTTLLNYFVSKMKASYLDDDCIYISNEKLFGLGLPISMRQRPKELIEKCIYTTDDESQVRNLICYAKEQKLKCENKIDLIIFPQYSLEQSVVKIDRIPRYHLFERLINNVRGSENIHRLYKDLKKITHEALAYDVKYNNCQDVVDLIEFLTKG